MDFRECRAQVVCIAPRGVVCLELPDVTDVPDVIANPISVLVGDIHLSGANLLAKLNRFDHGTIAMATASCVIDFARPWLASKMPEHAHEIEGMDIVAHLFALVAEYPILLAGKGTSHEIGKKAMEHRSRVPWTSQTATPEDPGSQPEIAPVFLHKEICRCLGRAKERMLALIDRHRFVDAILR